MSISVRGPEKAPVTLVVNGTEYVVQVEPRQTLLDVLRDELSLTGTKKVCDHGECGACSAIVDNRLIYACMTLAVECDGKDIRTIEGIAIDGRPDPVQQAFIEKDGYQCGFCTPGQVMAVTSLLDRNPDPSLDEVKRGVSGNLCRCGAYPKIFQSAQRAADLRRGEQDG
jgi:xanthine dehydrogenase YagT iron-sulfur-binding subunit